jgi:pilus assembly protein Flp/PilA
MQNVYAALVTLASFAKDRVREEKGATAVEYGLLVALIAGIIILVVGFLGNDILAAFNVVEDQLGGSQG